MVPSINKKNSDSSNPLPWSSPEGIHPDLVVIQKLLYTPCNFKYSLPLKDAENKEYGAYTFKLNAFSIKFRVAKITPTKVGQFVTLWKRIKNGPIQPYEMSDPFDLLIVITRTNEHFGQFVFSKSVLSKEGVLSIKGKGGKRALRVYPPWDKALNSQAKKTQKWQIEHFLEIPENKQVDYTRAQKLYSLS